MNLLTVQVAAWARAPSELLDTPCNKALCTTADSLSKRFLQCMGWAVGVHWQAAGRVQLLDLAHHRPSFPFRNVTNWRLMPFCLLTVKIGEPFRSITGSSPSAHAESRRISIPEHVNIATA